MRRTNVVHFHDVNIVPPVAVFSAFMVICPCIGLYDIMRVLEEAVIALVRNVRVST